MARVDPAALPPEPVAELAAAIEGLGPAVDADEARRAAFTAWRTAAELARGYRLVRPPLWHNFLVNGGLRDRGLCCHFAEDLLASLRALELQTLELHWVVASFRDPWREHSSVLLRPRALGRRPKAPAAASPGATRDGTLPEGGLVLDAWRASGDLVWAVPGEDEYPWEVHPLDGRWSELHCR